MVVTIISFLLIFCVIVISHEFGHFLLAKKNGIQVNEFFVGMGPTLFHFTKGETVYSLKLLPIGGACVFEGDDGLQEKKGEVNERAFPNAPIGARIATIFAGPLFNFLTAFLLAMILVSFCGTDRPVIQGITEGGQAQSAGLEVGDIITGINGEPIHLYRQITLISAMNKGEALEIEYKRDGVEGKTTVVPVYDEATQRYYIGIMGPGEIVKCGPLQTIKCAAYEVEYVVRLTFKSLGMLVQGKVTRDDVSGPVGIVKIVGDTYEKAQPYGISSVILSMMNIALLLSVNLGIMNLLPLPALDGGRLVFLIIELVRGKPVPAEKEGMVHLAGMIALMILMVFVLYNDITKFFV